LDILGGKEKKEMDRMNVLKANLWRISILILMLVLVGMFIDQFVLAKATPKKQNCEGIAIEMFRTQASLIPSSDVIQRRNVERRLRAWATMIAQCENSTQVVGMVALPTQEITSTSKPVLTTTPSPNISIILEGQPGGFFHSFEAKIENHWRGVIDGIDVFVLAGAWVKEPSQGFIAVRFFPPTGFPYGAIYESPNKTGALRIQDFQGLRLIIKQANDKTLLYFDIPAQMFVSSLEETVIPRTPTPRIEATGIPVYPGPLKINTQNPYPEP
jgi:hypothetical protein